MSASTDEVAERGRTHEAPPPRRRQFTKRTSLTILAYLTPAFIFVIIFTYYPLVVGGQMAFRKWSLYDLTSTPFIGLENFTTLIANPLFSKVMLNSLVWVVASLVVQFLIGFMLALGLRKKFRFRGVYQAMIFYPWAVSGFLIGILFRWMFNSEFGVFNDMLMRTGVSAKPIPWLANPDLALVAVIVANVWYGVAFFAIMILAALQSVPHELHEAAAIDGAGRWRTLTRVTIPTIRTTLVLTVLLRVIWIFNFPDIIYGMTGGGPGNQTQIATTWMIQFTQQGDYGLASALGFIVMGVLVVFTGVYLTLLTRERKP
ncbi:carbohydrate ABC transporter permease [Tessaracoccus antarcticus]|uniref:Sugar ABC transporter permease n=1 Tax=Tessaracoccus antarcticus TaxID=2479848 RepID=A0A3M0GAJ1_9ACTN|nr:sugar ABC transporter permease [Tessaracoccus antarcticus]RMB61317.1 sugar ABC transporter permease [Tessaracoccus antarcticus]